MIRISRYIHGDERVSPAIRSHILPLADERTRAPPVIFWNITHRCNLSCTHCYEDSGPDRSTLGELSTRESFALIDDLAEMRVPVILFSGGEPLMRQDFWEIAGYAAEQGLNTAISTNGTLIGEDTVERLIQSGISYAGISLDSAFPAIHDRIRGIPGSHVRSVRALRQCVRQGLTSGVRVTVTRENYRELDDLITIAREMKVPRFCVYWLVPSGRGRAIHHESQLSPAQVLMVLDLLYRRAKEIDPAEMEFLTVDAPQDAAYFLARMQDDNEPGYERARARIEAAGMGCSAGVQVACIDPGGNVYPCQFARYPEFLIGSILKRRFSEIWPDKGNAVLAAFREDASGIPEECSGCRTAQFCGGGCRMRIFAESGSLRGKDPLQCLPDGKVPFDSPNGAIFP
jgi:radical SAM protein with 4Fe4S-binding SPASM domain